MSLEQINFEELNGKCGICGVFLKMMEVTDNEKTELTGNWVTKWIHNLCKNHNPIIQYQSTINLKTQVIEFVKKINNNKITVIHKTKFFLANKENLGITRY